MEVPDDLDELMIFGSGEVTAINRISLITCASFGSTC
jgi:hypothetical protein